MHDMNKKSKFISQKLFFKLHKIRSHKSTLYWSPVWFWLLFKGFLDLLVLIFLFILHTMLLIHIKYRTEPIFFLFLLLSLPQLMILFAFKSFFSFILILIRILIFLIIIILSLIFLLFLFVQNKPRLKKDSFQRIRITV